MNSYEILGVPPNATLPEIKAAYLKKASALHPDVCQDKDSIAQFIKVNNAYRALTDKNYKAPYTPPPPRQKSNPPRQPERQHKQQIYKSQYSHYDSQSTDLWKNSASSYAEFSLNYWKEYDRLKVVMAYDEPEKFWEAMSVWTSQNS